MSLEIKFASKPENPDPRADTILTGFEDKNDPILIDDDGPDPASLGLPVSFDSTSKALAKPERPRGPQDKNRAFNVDAKNECNRNFKVVLSMWQSRRIEDHPKAAKFHTTLIDPNPQSRKYRCRLTLPTLENYDKTYVHKLRWAAENFAGRDCLDHIVKLGQMRPKEEESYYQFRDSYDIVMEAEKRESENDAPKERTRKRGNRGGKEKTEEDRKRHREQIKRREVEDRQQQKSAGKGWPSDRSRGHQSGSSLTTPASYHAGRGTNVNVTYGGEVTGVRRGAAAWGTPKASGWAPEPPSRVYQMPSAPARSTVGVYQMPESAYRQPEYRWAGAPGATSWQSQSKSVLYPPPNWCKEEVKTMILPMKLEMSALFDQPWFLEMTGDAQHSAWYAKRSEMEMKYAEQIREAKEEADRRMLEETKSLINVIKKTKEKTGYSDTVKARIKNFNWKDLTCYTEEELSCKHEELDEDIEKNKEQFTAWQNQCRQWESQMRGKSFVSQAQIQKIEETKKEWRGMAQKFSQVESKMRAQMNILATEIEFRNAPKKPDFFDSDIFQRPVSPTPAPKRYEPAPSPPPPDAPVFSGADTADLEIIDDLPQPPSRYSYDQNPDYDVFDAPPSRDDEFDQSNRYRNGDRYEPPARASSVYDYGLETGSRYDPYDPTPETPSYSNSQTRGDNEWDPPSEDPYRYSTKQQEDEYGFNQRAQVYDYDSRAKSPSADRWGLTPSTSTRSPPRESAYDARADESGWRSPPLSTAGSRDYGAAVDGSDRIPLMPSRRR